MLQVKNQKVELDEIKNFEVGLYIKREDELHPVISGNKYRKLKFNLKKAKQDGHHTLLSFGGAYSNHIAAVSFAGKEHGFKTIGVIRGEELKKSLSKSLNANPTLSDAFNNGMKFDFVSRTNYRLKHMIHFINDLKKKHGDFYLIPEGGTNTLAVKGCEEILKENDKKFEVICVAVGTGGTISGIINSVKQNQRVLGFPALKGDFLNEEIKKHTKPGKNWSLIPDYHFGGYAKINEDLVNFINNFKFETSIPLDPIYTGKMMFGLVDMIKRGQFVKGTKILAIHTGGLQGIRGMNISLMRKKLPIIK